MAAIELTYGAYEKPEPTVMVGAPVAVPAVAPGVPIADQALVAMFQRATLRVLATAPPDESTTFEKQPAT